MTNRNKSVSGSRPGEKAMMAAAKDWDLPVTDEEYAALIADDAVSKKIIGDSQYKVTAADLAVEKRAKAAMQTAQARRDAWHKRWEAATTDAERTRIEQQALAEESKMRKYRVRMPNFGPRRPGPRARFAVEDEFYFGKPGQPERFAVEVVASRGSKRAEIKRDATGRWAAVLIQSNRTGIPGGPADEQVLDMKWFANEANARRAAAKMLASRPGQPERFDASSLDRGDFADASTSPILGKLLAAKAMPEGGWRAVQAGSDTLVISFEDADLASDFGRRVASKGYNATSPVQAIGRYWNVEVKNG
jgi:hypothetical protein